MTADAEDEVGCHWTHPHAPHDWWPLVPDPQFDRVMHIGLVELRCPGLKREEERDDREHVSDVRGEGPAPRPAAEDQG